MSYITNPKDALVYLTRHIENITKKLDDTYQKPQNLENYPSIPIILCKNLKDLNNSGQSSSYYNSYGKDHNETKTPEETQKRYDSLCKVLDDYLPTIENIRIKNEVIIEHNIKVKDKIKSIMTSIGIPLTYSERDYTSRARNPKSITKSAGYLGDISRNIIIVDSEYSKRASLVKTVKTNLDTWYKTRLDLSKSLEKEKQIKEKELEKQKLFATIKVKYDIDFSINDSDILDNLLSKDKYLNLAHYMLKNREDWNDGYSYAEAGLDSFKIENHQDSLIYDNVYSNIKDWDGDGRCFRDCEWNYDRIFSLVDQDLMIDYNKIKEYLNE